MPDDRAVPRQATHFSGPGSLGAVATADLDAPPPARNSDVRLASGALREAVGRLQRGQQAGNAVQVVGQRMRVEILHHLSEKGIDAVVAAAAGTIDGRVPGVLIEGLV